MSSTSSTPRIASSWTANDHAVTAPLAEPDLSARALGIRHLAAKNARIKAEQDKQLLANRIKRLLAEQEKAVKRTEETRQRIAQIRQARERSVQHVQAQQEAHLLGHMERELQRQALQKAKSLREHSVAEARASVWRSRAVGSVARKQTRAEVEEGIRSQREAAERAAALKAELVRKAEAEAAARRVKEREGHLSSLAAREEAKRLELQQRRERHAQLLAQMEAEELQLIKSLTACQDDQRQAFEQLEFLIRAGAVATSEPETERLALKES